MRIDSFTSNPSSNQKFSNSRKISSKSFSQNLADTYKASTKESLDKSLDKIKNMGDILTETQSYQDIIKYKEMITNFLSDVVKYTYSLNKNNSFWEKNYFSTVEIIDEKLETMTREVLKNQKNNLLIASSVDEIQGLLLDVYK